MNGEPKVSISTYKRKDGHKSYYLRWPDSETGKLRSKSVGTDRKRAEREAALLEYKLRRGTYQDVRQVSWADFVQDDVSKIKGVANRNNNDIKTRHRNQVGWDYIVPRTQKPFFWLPRHDPNHKKSENQSEVFNLS